MGGCGGCWRAKLAVWSTMYEHADIAKVAVPEVHARISTSLPVWDSSNSHREHYQTAL